MLALRLWREAECEIASVLRSSQWRGGPTDSEQVDTVVRAMRRVSQCGDGERAPALAGQAGRQGMGAAGGDRSYISLSFPQ